MTDARGHVEDQVLVGEVAARRRVGKEEMLGDHERREVAGRQRHAHMVERLGRDPYARRHVSALTGLPDIVE